MDPNKANIHLSVNKHVIFHVSLCNSHVLKHFSEVRLCNTIKTFSKTCLFCYRRVIAVYLVVTYYLLLVGNSFKTCVIYVDLKKSLVTFSLFNRYILILNRVVKSIEDIGNKVNVQQNMF